MTAPADPTARPSLFSIPTGVAFADALAAGLEARAGDDPQRLADMTVLLPNRRAVRALTEAFLRRRTAGGLLLPRMRPIGDVDEQEMMLAGLTGPTAADAPPPPAIAEERRRMLLARQVMAWRGGGGPDGGWLAPGQAVRLADKLAHLLDEVEIEGLSFDRLAELAPDALAAHWQVTLDLLAIVTTHWPAVLAAEGRLDPADRRNRLLAGLAQDWTARPPARPVIAAGSTGSIPATAALLKVVARLPAGCVVLPGLDRDMDADSWAALTHTHPQHTLKHLLDRLGASRQEVADWPLEPAHRAARDARAARVALVHAALRPEATTVGWRDLTVDGPRAYDGLRRIDCRTLREEAGVIALMMREALETPERTAALVTPDRALARHVRAELARWDITIDDSAGRPLAATPPATFLRLLATAAAQAFAPVPLLAALKHPLAAGGPSPARFRALVRTLDRHVLRGARPGPGLDGLAEAVAAATLDDADRDSFARLARMLAPLEDAVAGPARPLGPLIDTHVTVAEHLAGPDRLWAGEAGEALATALEDIRGAADLLPEVAGSGWPDLFDALLAPRVVRPRYGTHPRLALWGPLEARLQQADLMILGGLNEGVWPPDPGTDPWMSRPMRAAFGLPPLDRRIGQSAHDFAQALGAPEVVLTRAEKVDGTPTVPSRWLLRLEALVGALPGGTRPWRAWFAALDTPDAVRPHPPPRPTPPVAARPAKLSVTGVEQWMRDPYGIYARHILGLARLDPLDADPSAADRGIFMHDALDGFLRRVGPKFDEKIGEDWPADALDLLLAEGRRAFGAALARPAVWAFWWPRFEKVAHAFLARERDERTGFELVGSEVRAELPIAGTARPFTLTAKADRIDRDRATGALEIIDYKTGIPPSAKRIAAGFAPQLPLEGLLAEAGAFDGVPAAVVDRLVFWRLRGGEPAIEDKAIDHVRDQIDRAEQGLKRLIDTFARARTPYLSHPRPAYARPGDYDHLARIKEWQGLLIDGGTP